MKGVRTSKLESADSITLKDVAKAARVSISTASRVLSRVDGFAVKEETRQRILAAAQEVNYRHNTTPRTTRGKRSHFIGLFLQDMESGTLPILLDGLEQAGAEMGYQILIHWGRDGVELQKTACTWLAERRIDAMVFSTALLPDERLREMDEQNLPYAMVFHSSATDRYASVDDRAGTNAIVDHLSNLGHRNIAYLSGPVCMGPYAWRLDCFKQALADFGLVYRPELTVGGGFGSWHDGAEGLQRILRGSTPFTAVVGATANLTTGALSAALRCGLRVPRDLSLVAFHDTPLNTMTISPLTAVRTPIRDVGRAVLRLLDDSLNNLPIKPIIVPGVELVVRGSSGPAPHR